LLPVAGLGIVLLARSPRAGPHDGGLAVGLGIPFLAVAYVNRPGAAGLGVFTPWPWLGIAVVCIVAGIRQEMRRTRR
jgi:hypothetical protein